MRAILLLAVALPALSLLHAEGLSGAVQDSPPDTGSSLAEATGTDAPALQKAADTPHFWQRDPRGAFENEGRDYCSPVAVSNSLVYLSRHGFPALLGDGDGVQPQIDLINLLASSDYFGTDPKNGTSPGSILFGVKKYVEEKGYHCARLEYEGWRPVGSRHQAEVRAARPSEAWLKQGILDPNGSVWLNVGWYTKVGDGEWKRTGGHWVTLVGYGAAKADDPVDPHLLLIHNPLIKGSDSPSDEVVYLQRIDSGTLHTSATSTEDAAGMYQVSGPGLPTSPGIHAFLDDAILLVVGP